jgi:hypothetical protein
MSFTGGGGPPAFGVAEPEPDTAPLVGGVEPLKSFDSFLRIDDIFREQ